jgi:hypothetical protein
VPTGPAGRRALLPGGRSAPGGIKQPQPQASQQPKLTGAAAKAAAIARLKAGQVGVIKKQLDTVQTYKRRRQAARGDDTRAGPGSSSASATGSVGGSAVGGVAAATSADAANDESSKRRRAETSASASAFLSRAFVPAGSAVVPLIGNSGEGGGDTTVYVGGLSPEIDQASLHEAFGVYGYIDTLRLVDGKNIAFVTYRDEAAAAVAIERMNLTDLGGAHA